MTIIKCESNSELERVFPGDSEMARRMRAFDWSKSGVGSPETWPQSLLIAIGICLSSRFPMHVWWGPSLTLFYNDAYISFLGRVKHPAVLGRSGQEAWPELWDTIGPMIHEVFTAGNASWSEDILMFFDRELPKEEVYVTFSFSPVYGESNKVEGMFCACTETTEKIIGNRRLDTLRKLGIQTTEACTENEACITRMRVLGENPYDIPFAAIYLVNESTEQAYLVTSTGFMENGHQLPQSVSFAGEEEDHLSPWPLATVLRTKKPIEITVLDALGIKQLGKPWPDPVRQAIILPIHSAGREKLAGLLIVGVSPRLPLNEAYHTFFGLVTGHIANAIADARSYEEERKRAEALLELDRAKTAFFSNVSHEFRTPLTLILGPLEELLQKELPQPLRGQIDIVRRNALRMHKLVNTLLDFSRIEAGRISAVYKPTDLAVYTEELASMFRSAIEKAGIKFNVDCPPLPEPIYVDRDMWEKIVLNLLSNAFKFTLEGEITIGLRWREDHAELIVGDTGGGIPENELPRLFERFHRVEGTKGRTYEGTGIGLALIKELTKLHGGTIGVQSQSGSGSRFTVSIPAGFKHLPEDRINAESALSSTATGAIPYIEEALRWLPEEAVNIDDLKNWQENEEPFDGYLETNQPRKRILVVDDNADMRSYLNRILNSRWTVELASDGFSALQAIQNNLPDIVLADIMMPGIDGIELLRNIRENQAIMGLPVIFLSARAGEEARVEGLEQGADDYLVKPFSARELVAKVDACLKMAHIRREVLTREQELLIIKAQSEVLRESEQEALTLVKNLEEADKNKNQYISVLSHELRNPLAAILAGVQMLNITKDMNQITKTKEIIERQTKQLSKLVDGLLELTRISQNKIKLKKDNINLNDIVNSAVEDISFEYDRKAIKLGTKIQTKAIMLKADPVRITQAIGNILYNALKFTNANGTVWITLKSEHNNAVISIKDNGIGMSSDLLKNLFTPFTQADNSLDRKNGGLGLGLSIVKGIIDLHGGTVSANSDGLGKGSTFTVSLPIEADNNLMENMKSDNTNKKNLKLLVIEDNRDFAELLSSMLSTIGYTVDIAYDGEGGLKLAKQIKPDVIFCDIGLPGMSGYDVAQSIRNDRELKDIHLIALTGYADENNVERALKVGFDKHLAKPIDFANLKNLLKNAYIS